MPPRTRHFLLILPCLCGVSLAAQPKLDRFGDPLPEGAIARLGSLHWRHEAAILTAAFTADGKALATCDVNAITYWDLDTGKCRQHMPHKIKAPTQLRRFSNDGKVLMLGDFKNVLHFVDAASGEEQGTLNHAQCGPIRGWPVLSRDGKILAAIHGGAISLWDVAGGKLLHEFKEPSLARVAPRGLIVLTPDGKQLVLPHADGSLHLVDVASGKEVRAFKIPPSPQNLHPSLRFQHLVLSPDGRYLAFSGSNTSVTVCELATGKQLRQLGTNQGFVSGLAFTPNSRFLAVESFNEVHLFGVLSGKEIRKLPKAPGGGNRLLFSPDGRTLVDIPSAYSIHLWDVVTQRRLHPSVGHEAAVKSLAFFPDGKRLVSADQTGEFRVWDIVSGQTIAHRTNNYGSVSLTVDRDGETVRFAGSDSVVHQWDLRTSREVRQKVGDGSYSNMLALSPDGRSLAVRVFKNIAPQKQTVTPELRLYDVKTNKSIVLPRATEEGGVGHLTFTPDSCRLAACCSGGVLRLWDRDTGKLVRELKRAIRMGNPSHLVFTADGRSLFALMDDKVRIREVASGADRLQIPPGPLFSLAYSPDARFVATGQGDGQIFVYSAVSGKQLAQWQSNQGYVHALTCSRDGRLLASGGANGTILIWELPQDERLPIVLEAKEADSLWLALGDSDAAAANRALVGLAAAPDSALSLLRERLGPLGKQLDQPQYARLIAQLDDDSFKVREKATRELALAGADAADALREALQNIPSAECKRRIEDLLSLLKKGGYSRRLRFPRALEVLERIGTPQAKELFRELAGKPMPKELQQEVQASLRRMDDKP